VVRARVARRLEFLGVAVDDARNAAHGGGNGGEITGAGATVRTLVVAAREDLEIARGVRAVLGC
jgi:acetate kinase